MTTQSIEDKLIHFLSTNYLLSKFKQGLLTCGRRKVKDIESLMAYMKKTKIGHRQLIFVAFYWPATKEGMKFWLNVSKEWKEYLKKGGK